MKVKWNNEFIIRKWIKHLIGLHHFSIIRSTWMWWSKRKYNSALPDGVTDQYLTVKQSVRQYVLLIENHRSAINCKKNVKKTDFFLTIKRSDCFFFWMNVITFLIFNPKKNTLSYKSVKKVMEKIVHKNCLSKMDLYFFLRRFIFIKKDYFDWKVNFGSPLFHQFLSSFWVRKNNNRYDDLVWLWWYCVIKKVKKKKE